MCVVAGASYGQWRMPWAPAEREDSIEVIDWITKQSWSNGQVCLAANPQSICSQERLPSTISRQSHNLQVFIQVILSGVSYEATAALFTLSMHHPAIKGCLAQYPFWCALIVSWFLLILVGSCIIVCL